MGLERLFGELDTLWVFFYDLGKNEVREVNSDTIRLEVTR